jgi:copper chaperone NosL
VSRNARVLILIASLLLASGFTLPLWHVGLIAPQYPEGLGMLIRVNTVVGVKEQDLNSINGLNHYIGMKKIEPDTIPELKLMPVILGVLVLSGLGVAALGKKWPMIGWAAALGGLQVAGLVDFWKWEYDYGHDLDTVNAIIKIPGMSYQPPVIGSKQLLNFTATSWPASGGWMWVLAALLTAAALWITFRRSPTSTAAASGRMAAAAAVLIALVAVSACAQVDPEPIALGKDACDQCRMTISDARFGGEAITSKGRILRFDSVECLAAWSRAGDQAATARYYVIDLQHPGTFVRADSAGFLRGAMLGSPMGGAVLGFVSLAAAEQQRAMLGGEVVSWEQLRAAAKPTMGPG